MNLSNHTQDVHDTVEEVINYREEEGLGDRADAIAYHCARLIQARYHWAIQWQVRGNRMVIKTPAGPIGIEIHTDETGEIVWKTDEDI